MFDLESQRGGIARARFWSTQAWTNLQRGEIARWIYSARHWPESYLTDYLADLSDHTKQTHKRRKRR